MLEIKFSSQAKKFLKNLDRMNWDRIMGKILSLKSVPFPHKVKRVEGRGEKTFRIRVGYYRILYVLFQERNTLFISKIDKRSKVY
jgi:mRNA interferase RelE/StbE